MLKIDIENTEKLGLKVGENIHLCLKNFEKSFEVKNLIKHPPSNDQYYRIAVIFLYQNQTKNILLDVNKIDDIIDYISFPCDEGLNPTLKDKELLNLKRDEVVALTAKYSLGICAGKDRIDFMALNIGFYFGENSNKSSLPKSVYIYNYNLHRSKVYIFRKKVKRLLLNTFSRKK